MTSKTFKNHSQEFSELLRVNNQRIMTKKTTKELLKELNDFSGNIKSGIFLTESELTDFKLTISLLTMKVTDEQAQHKEDSLNADREIEAQQQENKELKRVNKILRASHEHNERLREASDEQFQEELSQLIDTCKPESLKKELPILVFDFCANNLQEIVGQQREIRKLKKIIKTPDSGNESKEVIKRISELFEKYVSNKVLSVHSLLYKLACSINKLKELSEQQSLTQASNDTEKEQEPQELSKLSLSELVEYLNSFNLYVLNEDKTGADLSNIFEAINQKLSNNKGSMYQATIDKLRKLKDFNKLSHVDSLISETESAFKEFARITQDETEELELRIAQQSQDVDFSEQDKEPLNCDELQTQVRELRESNRKLVKGMSLLEQGLKILREDKEEQQNLDEPELDDEETDDFPY